MIDFSNVVVINVLVQFMDLSYMIPRIEVTIKLICFPPPRPRLFQFVEPEAVESLMMEFLLAKRIMFHLSVLRTC